jgi:hypothetical protein
VGRREYHACPGVSSVIYSAQGNVSPGFREADDPHVISAGTFGKSDDAPAVAHVAQRELDMSDVRLDDRIGIYGCWLTTVNRS